MRKLFFTTIFILLLVNFGARTDEFSISVSSYYLALQTETIKGSTYTSWDLGTVSPDTTISMKDSSVVVLKNESNMDIKLQGKVLDDTTGRDVPSEYVVWSPSSRRPEVNQFQLFCFLNDTISLEPSLDSLALISSFRTIYEGLSPSDSAFMYLKLNTPLYAEDTLQHRLRITLQVEPYLY